MQYYYVRNWRRFQHYKHRNPPWVKLYRDIFTSPDWLQWTDHDRLVALCCLSLASFDGGWLPDDPLWIKHACHLSWRVNLQPLINTGFLTLHASKTLAETKEVLATCYPESRVQSPESESKIGNGFLNGKSGEGLSTKKKPQHGRKTKNGRRIWFDCGTDEWKAHANDFSLAHNGVGPQVLWHGTGSWFNYLGEYP